VVSVGGGAVGTWRGGAAHADAASADADPAAAAAAADAVGGEAVPLESDATYDVVCIAVPLSHAAGAIADHASRADAAIVDVSGAMVDPLAAMARHAPALERASLHPLFAPERAPGSIAVVREDAGLTIETLLATLEDRGNDLVETTPEEHDEAMETVQSATHAAVLAFALAAESVPEGFETPIYEELRALATRVTAGTPRVYADIQETFAGAEAVADAARELADADHDEFESLYAEAARKLREEGDQE
ncbi:prephenate dehydrogenase, partial [Natronococcus sp. JC468]|uniref:prephenate dehydrogenase dimerization domain-containing protein n=1 Tax=Natronococcus sp. JC468 TaxID=1961921 RepID=UPI00143B3328